MRCFASATCARKLSIAAAITSWLSKTTSPPCEPTSPLNFSRPFPPYTEKKRRESLDEARSVDKQHGRREHRHLQTTTRLTGHLNWPSAQQVCRIERTTHRDGKKTVETDYAITSVPRDLADASTLLAWWRGHWGIENRLHWVRDMTFGEDASRIRTGGAPQLLAALRNAGISLLRSLGIANIAEALRENACKVDDTLTELGIPHL